MPNSTPNKKKYNGIEETRDLDLNQYDAFYRILDPQIGRWWQVDPKTEDMEQWSPYASNYDNPITYSDPLGDEPDGDGPGDPPSTTTRILGAVKAVGGLVEMVVGAVGGAATSWTGIGAVVGGAAVVHGADVVSSGFSQMFSGQETKTFTEKGISKGLQTVGVSEQKANTVATYTDVGISTVLTVGSGAAANGSKIKTFTSTESAAPKSVGPITGHTKHGLNQSIGRDGGRGVNAAAKLDAVKNPIKVVAQAGDKTKYVGKNAQVVLNSGGKVVSTFGKSRGSEIYNIGKGNAAQRRAKSMGF